MLYLANPLNAEQPMKYFQVIPQNTCKIVTQQFKQLTVNPFWKWVEYLRIAGKWCGYTKARQARQNHPRRSKTKKWLVLSGFMDQKFAGNFKKVVQMMQDSTRISLCLKKDRIWCCLAQSGQLVSSFLQTSGAGSQIEPAIFLSGSVWDDFVWLVWSWCNHTIKMVSIAVCKVLSLFVPKLSI